MKKTLYKPQTDDVNISVNVYNNESCNNTVAGCNCPDNSYTGCSCTFNGVNGCSC